ncbi:MAG: hypothetical protein CMA99_04025 [Euryarchaeota archaeon]|nr:hypothetical protein [Euryarchaeota archaeon]
MGRRRQRQRDMRRQHAVTSQKQLLSLLYDVPNHTLNRRQTYANHLYKISRRHRIRFSNQAKEVVCRKCSTLLVQGTTSRVRLRNGMKVVHCLQCGDIRRIPYKHNRRVLT